MDNATRYLILSGSTRRDSLHRRLAKRAAEEIRESGGEVTLVELSEFPMPIYDGDWESENGLPEPARALKRLLAEHDAIVIASPEYNGSIPALLKNLIDWTSRPEPGERRHSAAWRGKPFILLATSPGPNGGSKGLAHLRDVIEHLGGNVLASTAIPFGRIEEATLHIPALADRV